MLGSAWGQAGALHNLIKWKMSLSLAEELELDDLWDPFQSKLYYSIKWIVWSNINTKENVSDEM